MRRREFIAGLGSAAAWTQAAAADLVRSAPDVILATGGPALAPLQQATRTIPIVFLVVSEPVALGFVASLARPGGNITGFTNLEPTIGAKLLELLKEMAPRVTRFAVMFNPNTSTIGAQLSRSAETAAQKFAVELVDAEVRQPADIETTIAARSPFPCAPGRGRLLPVPWLGGMTDATFCDAAAILPRAA